MVHHDQGWVQENHWNTRGLFFSPSWQSSYHLLVSSTCVHILSWIPPVQSLLLTNSFMASSWYFKDKKSCHTWKGVKLFMIKNDNEVKISTICRIPDQQNELGKSLRDYHFSCPDSIFKSAWIIFLKCWTLPLTRIPIVGLGSGKENNRLPAFSKFHLESIEESAIKDSGMAFFCYEMSVLVFFLSIHPIEMSRSIDCIMLQIVLSWKKILSRIPFFPSFQTWSLRSSKWKSGELQRV